MIRIVENLLILYYVFYFIIDWIFMFIFLKSIKKENVNFADDDKFADFPKKIKSSEKYSLKNREGDVFIIFDSIQKDDVVEMGF